MHELQTPLLAVLVAFLAGSLPFGLWVARLFKVGDLRSQGSGNIGATNVTRVAGVKAGVLTFLLDFLKGALPVLLFSLEPVTDALERWSGVAFEATPAMLWTIGLCAVVGHCYTPWLRFHGGKGVATGFGVIAVLSPIAALFGVIGYAAAFLEKRIGSLASIAGLALASGSYIVVNQPGNELWIAGLMIFLILLRHEKNIDALLESREHRFH